MALDYYRARIQLGAAAFLISRSSALNWLWQDLTSHKPTAMVGKFGHRESVRFLIFAMLNRARSRAQLLQDLWALYELREKTGGFFVEFGATDGVNLSNSYLLEKAYGWSGILAEPSPVWHPELHRNRSVRIDHRCVWSKTGEEIEFVNMEEGELSTAAEYLVRNRTRGRGVKEKFSVQTISLTDLLIHHSAP